MSWAETLTPNNKMAKNLSASMQNIHLDENASPAIIKAEVDKTKEEAPKSEYVENGDTLKINTKTQTPTESAPAASNPELTTYTPQAPVINQAPSYYQPPQYNAAQTTQDACGYAQVPQGYYQIPVGYLPSAINSYQAANAYPTSTPLPQGYPQASMAQIPAAQPAAITQTPTGQPAVMEQTPAYQPAAQPAPVPMN